MPIKTIEEFKVSYLQILDENGACDEKLMPELSKDDIKSLYEWMVLTRVFDEIALKLQREGRILTYAPMKGQEAAQIGSAAAMRKQDWLFPAFRENGAMMLRGFPAHMLYQYWGGDERGMKVPEHVNCFTVAVPVSTQIPHAVGFAWGNKLQKKDIITLVYFGDGATSKGDFSEALNFAGTFKVPVIFINQNNQWAISLPVSRQTAAKTLAQKAIAYGFEGIKIDGNDVFAVYKATKDAIEKAKKGLGPTYIECLTYRIADHTTADDQTKYRDQKEVEEWKKKDPIDRLEKYMIVKKILTKAEKEKIWAMAQNKIDDSVKAAEAAGEPDPKDIFNYTYSELTSHLKEQMKEALGE